MVNYDQFMDDGVDRTQSWEPTMPADPGEVRLVVVSECAATDPKNNYGASAESEFDTTTLLAFEAAGLPVQSIDELAGLGIHLTVAVGHPKTKARIGAATIAESAQTLEEELAQFPNAQAYLLMGDVPIAAVNKIARTRNGKRAIPAGSTYRIRSGEYELDGIRLFPSYLQAGPA